MQRPLKIWGLYMGLILILSLTFSFTGISKITFSLASEKILVTPIMMVSIAGGFVAMRLTVLPGAFKTFSVIYLSLWALRFLLLYAGNHIGQVNFNGKLYHIDFIVSHYYENTSRLDTPLPFLLFSFINHFIISRADNKSKP